MGSYVCTNLSLYLLAHPSLLMARASWTRAVVSVRPQGPRTCVDRAFRDLIRYLRGGGVAPGSAAGRIYIPFYLL